MQLTSTPLCPYSVSFLSNVMTSLQDRSSHWSTASWLKSSCDPTGSCAAEARDMFPKEVAATSYCATQTLLLPQFAD